MCRRLDECLIRSVAFAAILLASSASFGQANRAELLAKADASVVAKAAIGTPQRVVITLDADEAFARAAKRASERMTELLKAGRTPEGEEPWQMAARLRIEEDGAATDRLIAVVFPNGWHGRVRLREVLRMTAQAFVEVDDIDALLDLLALEQVKRISALPTVGIAGAGDARSAVRPMTGPAEVPPG